MMSHSDFPVYESVITVTRTTVAVQALQIVNISFYCILFCLFTTCQPPISNSPSGPDEGRTPQLVVMPPWLICTRAAVALKPDTKTLQHRSR